MTRVFLLGGPGGGGEEVFVRDLAASPPDGFQYSLALEYHESTEGARARTVHEIVLNRLVHPFLWPLPGFRAYDVDPTLDLIHVHNFPVWLGGRRDRPVVISVGGSGYPHYLETYLGWDQSRIRARYGRARRLYRFFGVASEIATHERVDAVVVFSDPAAEVLADFGVPAAKLHVVPPGFAIAAPPDRGDAEGPYTFLLVGRHPERKGADLAVAATRRLRAAGHHVRLILVGDEAYPAMADGEGLDGHGPVGRERLFRDFFGRADAVLVPSRAEGFGFAAVEGMGHALPVVVSRRDALPWIIGEGGIVVEPGSEEALARAMAALAGDPQGARALGHKGRNRFDAVFTRERARAALAQVYHGVLGPDGGLPA